MRNVGREVVKYGVRDNIRRLNKNTLSYTITS